jgi:son of sevenless
MPESRIQAVRQHLHISIDPYRPSHGRSQSSPATSTSLSSSARASISTSRASVSTASTAITSCSTVDTPTASSAYASEWILVSVLCLHDFESNDADHLSFNKNEILHVVKKEETGWWAAVRENCTQVGWIPSAFVAELDGVELEKLQKVRFDLRVYEYDAERLYNSAPISQRHDLYLDPGRSTSMETSAEGGAKVSSAGSGSDSQQFIARLYTRIRPHCS